MNSIWNKNLTLFIKRFPELAAMFSLSKESDIPQELPAHLLASLEIIPSKSGSLTAKDVGKLLHSAYNPLREAEQAAMSLRNSVKDCEGCAFFSCGLGYTPLAYAKLFPKDTIIIIENDPRYFFTALSLVDWQALFAHPKCIIALGLGLESVVGLIEHTSGLKATAICDNPAQSGHSRDYFSALHDLIKRNRRKGEINASTLEKFSKLWLKNTCKNLHFLKESAGINVFKDSCPADLPVLILAAGPTLREILPFLSELKKRTLVIAVDTALRACLRAKVEPDFLVLTDPQYYAYRHIAGLSSPSSILITESAAYPAVFRFNCKQIVMCSSLFPLGHYFESKIGQKGTLVAGGSVSTTAWDFARFIGAKEIFCAGLDLGFPGLQTHIRGSTFEEKVHSASNRLSPAEKSGIISLFAANMSLESDYEGGTILTDSKMKMFAWWFESKQEEFKGSIKSYSLSPKSLKIPGFSVASGQELLDKKEKGAEKSDFFSKALGEKNQNDMASLIEENSQKYDEAYENLLAGLEDLYATAKKGLSVAESGISSVSPAKDLAKLQEIDKNILHSQYKEIASLVFPAEKKLASIIEKLPQIKDKNGNPDELKSSLQKSKVIYQELMKSVRMYQNYLD